MIYMRSEVLRVVRIKKKTTAKLFKDLKVGSYIVVTCPLVYYDDRDPYRRHKKRVNIKNLGTGAEVNRTLLELSDLLKNFEFREDK